MFTGTTLPLDVYAALARRAQPPARQPSCDGIGVLASPEDSRKSENVIRWLRNADIAPAERQRPLPKPTNVPPGPDKVSVLYERLEAKQQLWHPADASLKAMSESLCIFNERIRNGRDRGVRLSMERIVRKHKEEVRRRKREGEAT